MKSINKLLSGIILLFMSLGIFSCQDFDRPEMVIIPDPEPPTYNPLKLLLSFDGNEKNTSVYTDFIATSAFGSITYPTGVTNQSYKGGDGMYILINPDNVPGKLMLADTLSRLKGFTVSFWMNLPTANKAGAQCIFSIPHKTKGWGNMDIYTDNDGAKVKMHTYNKRTGTLKDGWVDYPNTGVIDRWAHYVFRYDGTTSTFNIFIDGNKIVTHTIADFGEIVFETPNSYILGNFGQNATPKLSTTDLGTWAAPFKGQLDQFRFYNATLTDAQIAELFNSKQ